uniref:Uncharacterized protein n=1 Tax=Microcystis aeruginosa TaxID=1126 RepID=Q48895_MICAE|nr:unnamed protein product [Microcystis aeruginosa]
MAVARKILRFFRIRRSQRKVFRPRVRSAGGDINNSILQRVCQIRQRYPRSLGSPIRDRARSTARIFPPGRQREDQPPDRPSAGFHPPGGGERHN